MVFRFQRYYENTPRQCLGSGYFQDNPTGEAGRLTAFEENAAGLRERQAGAEGLLVHGELLQSASEDRVFGFEESEFRVQSAAPADAEQAGGLAGGEFGQALFQRRHSIAQVL